MNGPEKVFKAKCFQGFWDFFDMTGGVQAVNPEHYACFDRGGPFSNF